MLLAGTLAPLPQLVFTFYLEWQFSKRDEKRQVEVNLRLNY